jgi:hypothetical protein
MRHALPGPEQPLELALELGHGVQRRNEVQVDVHQERVHLREHEQVVSAVEQLVHELVLVPQVQEHVGGTDRTVALAGSFTVFFLSRRFRYEYDWSGFNPSPEPGQVRDGEVRREDPRRVRERLAEQVVVVGRGVEEEDAVVEEHVDGGADQGQHAVAEAVVWDSDEVVALHGLRDATGTELLHGLGVVRRAGGAPLYWRRLRRRYEDGA